jgi:hypothetical protein
MKPLSPSWVSIVAVAFLTASARADNTFLGSIPVQYAAPGQELVLDMHRFFQSGSGAKLDVATKDDVGVTFDAASFQLHVRPKKTGLFEIERFITATKSA